MIVVSNDESLGSVEIVSGSGYSDESITITANEINNGMFVGWYNNDVPVSDSKTFSFAMPTNDYSLTARFISWDEWNNGHGVTPQVNVSNNTVAYGLYPQTVVSDSATIALLDSSATLTSNGWYYSFGEFFVKKWASPYSSNAVFGNGQTIKSAYYWFKCEPIQWNILEKSNGQYWLFASKLLDVHSFGGYYWKVSELRTWLNDHFYNTAFALNKSYIQLTTVRNSQVDNPRCYSSDPYYYFDDTQDYVFTLSARELGLVNLGFEDKYGGSNNAYLSASDTRVCKVTDYAKAGGAYYSTLNYGYYLTRSYGRPVTNYDYIAPWSVSNSGSVVTTQGGFYPNNSCIRPSIKIVIS